jgi:membrane-associated phospholipid phosphatase
MGCCGCIFAEGSVYIAMRIVLRPSDILTLSFLVLISCAAVLSARVNPSWAELLTTYVVLAVMILAAAVYCTRVGPAKKGFYLSVAVTVITVLSIFDSLGPLIAGMHTTTFDSSLISIDHALFGVHPTVWLERLISPTLSALLQFAYISYYFIPLALGFALIAGGRLEEFEEALFGILLCFYLSYVGYLIVPAIGPRFTLSHLQTSGLQVPPFVEKTQDLLNGLEKNKTDAFPSGHTAVSLVSLYYAWSKKEKKLFVGLIPVVTGLLFSTVYLRYHYVIDVIAGIALSILTVYLAPILFAALSRVARRTGGRVRHAP